MKKILYKFTKSDLTTYGNTKWILGCSKKTSGIHNELCNCSWLHAYEDPYVAVLLRSLHIDSSYNRLFKAESCGQFKVYYDGKCGVTELKLVEEIPLPKITSLQYVNIAAHACLEYYKLVNKWVENNPVLDKWIQNWLKGKNRNYKAFVLFKQEFNNSYRHFTYTRFSNIIESYFNAKSNKKPLPSNCTDYVANMLDSIGLEGVNILAIIYKGLLHK